MNHHCQRERLSISAIKFCSQIVPNANKKSPAKPINTGFVGIYVFIQTPRRETYHPCEGLISGTFNGDYYIFYHNYFMFSKIQVSYGYHIQVFLLKNYIIFITHVHNAIY